MIDLRSDTFTSPCLGMRRAMAEANTGDDCYGEDPTVKRLEERCADLFQKESALFMPTGTMSNQVAIKSWTNSGDEVLTHTRYHVYYYEAAPSSAFSGIHFGAISTEDGSIKASDLEQFISAKPRGPLYAESKLLVLENSVCSLGGKAFGPSKLMMAKSAAIRHGLNVHLDGARILNACITTNSRPQSFGQVCDSISMCFSKGLGAPMGSILVGSRDFVETARCYRKWFGGALHQSGVIAAACLYSLEHIGLKQIQQDHNFAAQVYVDLVDRVGKSALKYHKSNMILISCQELGANSSDVVKALEAVGILVLPWDGHSIRLVFHRGVKHKQVINLGSRIARVFDSLNGRKNFAIKQEKLLHCLG